MRYKQQYDYTQYDYWTRRLSVCLDRTHVKGCLPEVLSEVHYDDYWSLYFKQTKELPAALKQLPLYDRYPTPIIQPDVPTFHPVQYRALSEVPRNKQQKESLTVANLDMEVDEFEERGSPRDGFSHPNSPLISPTSFTDDHHFFPPVYPNVDNVILDPSKTSFRTCLNKLNNAGRGFHELPGQAAKKARVVKIRLTRKICKYGTNRLLNQVGDDFANGVCVWHVLRSTEADRALPCRFLV